jgi:hypothetical protein
MITGDGVDDAPALSLLAIYTPPGNFVLSAIPLTAGHLLEVIAVALLPTLGLSAIKEIFGFDVA